MCKSTDKGHRSKFAEIVRKVAIFPFIVLITFYRKCISPYTPPACRFTPTCSEYALQAFRKWGRVFLNFTLGYKKSRTNPYGSYSIYRVN